jgi:hypothetical protein
MKCPNCGERMDGSCWRCPAAELDDPEALAVAAESENDRRREARMIAEMEERDRLEEESRSDADPGL